MISAPRYPHPSCRRGKEGAGGGAISLGRGQDDKRPPLFPLLLPLRTKRGQEVFPLPLGEGRGEGQDCAEKKESG